MVGMTQFAIFVTTDHKIVSYAFVVRYLCPQL